MDEAKDLNTTLHRVVNRISNKLRAIDQAIELGFDQVFTSGGAQHADAGATEIAKMMRHARAEIIIMPDGGINVKNVGKIIQVTNASEFYASCCIERKGPSPNLFTQKFTRITSADEKSKIKATLKIPSKSRKEKT